MPEPMNTSELCYVFLSTHTYKQGTVKNRNNHGCTLIPKTYEFFGTVHLIFVDQS